MVTVDYFYHLMIYVYALSLLFYFSDFASANRKAKQTGTGLLTFVWILQTVFFIYRMLSHMNVNVVTLFDYLFFFSWLLVTISLVMSRFFRIEFLVFFVNVIGFVVLALNVFSQPSASMPIASLQLVRGLLYVHITLISCAYAVLTIGAIFAGMYLFLHGKLKGRKWSMRMRRLPSLESIDRYTFTTALIGTPLLILSLATAIATIIVEGQAALLLDWKVFSSAVAAGMYVVYILRRTIWLQPGWRTARWKLISFSLLIINLLLNSASRFHHWS